MYTRVRHFTTAHDQSPNGSDGSGAPCPGPGARASAEAGDAQLGVHLDLGVLGSTLHAVERYPQLADVAEQTRTRPSS
jgi:hypothetical protein